MRTGMFLSVARTVTLAVLVGTSGHIACKIKNPLVDRMNDAAVQVKKKKPDITNLVPVPSKPQEKTAKPEERNEPAPVVKHKYYRITETLPYKKSRAWIRLENSQQTQ